MRPTSFLPLLLGLTLACGTTSTNGDGGTEAGGGDAAAEADAQPQHTNTHDCSPVCGSTQYCAYPLSPGVCPGPHDGGVCPNGCPGCPNLPPPSCTALPAACNGTPTCGCLLTVCPGGCGGPAGDCSIDADGDWVIHCNTC